MAKFDSLDRFAVVSFTFDAERECRTVLAVFADYYDARAFMAWKLVRLPEYSITHLMLRIERFTAERFRQTFSPAVADALDNPPPTEEPAPCPETLNDGPPNDTTSPCSSPPPGATSTASDTPETPAALSVPRKRGRPRVSC